VPAEPALERSWRGDLRPRVHQDQLDPDSAGSPAGMVPAQRQRGLQPGRSRRSGPTGVIAGLQRGDGAIGPRLEEGSRQTPDRTQGQAELAGDFRGGGPVPDHEIKGQPQSEFCGAWHRSRLPDPGNNRDHGTVPENGRARNLVSEFRTEDRVR
jgi:hypothetical protein